MSVSAAEAYEIDQALQEMRRQGLSLSDMADHLGYGPSILQRHLGGELPPTPTLLRRVRRALNFRSLQHVRAALRNRETHLRYARAEAERSGVSSLEWEEVRQGIEQMRAAGLTFHQIAVPLGSTEVVVSSIARGVTAPSQRVLRAVRQFREEVNEMVQEADSLGQSPQGRASRRVRRPADRGLDAFPGPASGPSGVRSTMTAMLEEACTVRRPYLEGEDVQVPPDPEAPPMRRVDAALGPLRNLSTLPAPLE